MTALRSNFGIRAKILVMLVAGAVAISGAEIFLFWDPLELRGPRPRAGFDLRETLDVVRDLRTGGTDAYPVLAVTTWLESPPRVEGTPVLPLSGVPRAMTVMCNESGTYVTYESDRYGFNAPDGQWDRRAEVALIGDSYVEGWCVPRDDSFAGLIRREIPATLNVGYTGHGPLAELGTLKEYVASHRPERVFWFFYDANDLTTDLPREMDSDILRRYLGPGFGQRLQARAKILGREMRRRADVLLARYEPPPPVSPLASIVKLRSLRALIRSHFDLQFNGFDRKVVRSQGPVRPLEEFRSVLVEAKRTVEEWGGSLYFVYLPDLPSTIGEQDYADRERVLATAGDLKLEILDLLPDFMNHPSPVSLFPVQEGRHLVKTRGVHYNAAGHRLVARRVLEFLRANSAGPHPEDSRSP